MHSLSCKPLRGMGMSVEDTGDIPNHLIFCVTILEKKVAATELDRGFLVILHVLVEELADRVWNARNTTFTSLLL